MLDQRLDPLLRADGIGAAHWEPDAAAAAVLERAGAFHWYVLGDRDGLPVASALAAVEFGAPGTAVGTVR